MRALVSLLRLFAVVQAADGVEIRDCRTEGAVCSKQFEGGTLHESWVQASGGPLVAFLSLDGEVFFKHALTEFKDAAVAGLTSKPG